jgi:hypothetical protein
MSVTGGRTGGPARAGWATVAAALVLALWPRPGAAHEERLLVGRVETIAPARKLLVLVDAQAGKRRRLEVNPETEVIACRTGAGLAVLHRGAMVRVKYLERAGGPLEVRSVLLLGGPR